MTATILISAVFMLGGLVMFMLGHWFGFKSGQEYEQDRAAERFHEFRLRKFNGGYDEN